MKQEMKPKFSLFWASALVVLLLLGTPPAALAAQPQRELVTVISSVSIYDPSTYTMQCQRRWQDGKDICIKVARPDKPFPLPIGFWTTVRRDSGEIQTLRSADYYAPDGRVYVEVSE